MSLYIKQIKILIKSQMQYKISFFMTIIGDFCTSFMVFLEIYFMFNRFKGVEGFSFNEVLLCFSVVLTAYSLAECLARGFDVFQVLISNGQFDRMLVRPRGELFQVLASRIEFSRLGRLAQALVILAYAVPTCGVSWNAAKICTLFIMIAGGFCAITGLFIIHASLCFFTIEGLEVMNILTDGCREFGKYPFSIYGESVLRFLTFVIPLALFQYYPLLYLLEKNSRAFYPFLPLAAALFLIPCFGVWKFGLRHYKSTGS